MATFSEHGERHFAARPSKLLLLAATGLLASSALANTPFKLEPPSKHASEANISAWHSKQQSIAINQRAAIAAKNATRKTNAKTPINNAARTNNAPINSSATIKFSQQVHPEDWFQPTSDQPSNNTDTSSLQLRGVMLQGQHPMALINENWLRVGQQVDGAVVKKIATKQVTLRRANKTIQLKLNKQPLTTAGSIPNPATEWLLAHQLDQQALHASGIAIANSR